MAPQSELAKGPRNSRIRRHPAANRGKPTELLASHKVSKAERTRCSHVRSQTKAEPQVRPLHVRRLAQTYGIHTKNSEHLAG